MITSCQGDFKEQNNWLNFFYIQVRTGEERNNPGYILHLISNPRVKKKAPFDEMGVRL
jgi:uncharacterized protein YpiB (UPF0302 family)